MRKDMFFNRAYKVRPVKLSQMRVHSTCQRQERPGWKRYLLEHWDFDQFGIPVVNYRDGIYWIIDGQHRIAALREAGFEDEAVDCAVHENLSDVEMATMFLRLNDRKSVGAFDKFMVGVVGCLPDELAVLRMVESTHLKVSRRVTPGAVTAVSALLRVYKMHGDVVLGQALRTLRDAFDSAPEGFDGMFVQAVAMVYNRYNGHTNEKHLVNALASLRHGPTGLRQRAALIEEKTGADMRHCLAQAIVEIYNHKAQRNERLDSWWKAQEAA